MSNPKEGSAAPRAARPHLNASVFEDSQDCRPGDVSLLRHFTRTEPLRVQRDDAIGHPRGDPLSCVTPDQIRTRTKRVTFKGVGFSLRQDNHEIFVRTSDLVRGSFY